MWYAIQTFTGKEEQLTELIRRIVPSRNFGDCFVPYFERLRRWHRQNQICILRLFPGYILLSTDDVESVFHWLKKVPAMTKIMAAGPYEFAPLYDNEAKFLMDVLDSDHIVRLTYAATDGKDHVTYLAGPLEKCRGRIQAYKFRDRYAQVHLTIAGQEKTVRMGIILNNDIRRQTPYGKVEAHIPTPKEYTPTSEKPVAVLHPGDPVLVVGGAFEGNPAVVREVRNTTILIAVPMFGREIPVEVFPEEVQLAGAEGYTNEESAPDRLSGLHAG